MTKFFKIGTLPVSFEPIVTFWFIVTKSPIFVPRWKTTLPRWTKTKPGPIFTDVGRSTEKNIQINLLMKVIFARIDEIFDLIFKDFDYSYFFKNDKKSILIFIGEGSKILNKNSITLNEKFDYFDEINFFEENTTLVCDSGYKFIQMKNPNEISLVPKKSDKYGFFEKMFNLFK